MHANGSLLNTAVMNFRQGKYKVLTEPLMGADKPNLDQELELSSEEVAFDIDVENQIKAKRDSSREKKGIYHKENVV